MKHPDIFKRGEWVTWFAWYPVRINGHWRIFKWVERRRVFCAGAGFATNIGYEYD